MKRFSTIMSAILLAIFCLPVMNTGAQENEENELSFSAGLDIYSSYMWRGTKFGQGPAFQPSVNFSKGGLSIGAWGSGDASGYMEADLFASYEFGFGLSLGITDYYYPTLLDSLGVYQASNYFDYSVASGTHAFEINLGYSIKDFSISANYILNQAGGAATAGGDKYIELGYSFGNLGLFLGAGDGWHTSDGKFNVCNIGLSAGKEIPITEKFSLPLSGSVIFNPEKKFFNVVVGLSF